MRLKIYSSPSLALYTVRTAWDLMVMPLSRSRSMLSSTWDCISRLVKRPVRSMMRSARVDLP